MKKLPLGLTVLLLAARAFADDADTRTAKITDRSDIESQVSSVTVSNVDERFGFTFPDNRSRMVIATPTIAWSIPIHSVNSILRDGPSAWTVKYHTKDGDVSVQGDFSSQAELLGSSDFGSFTLPLRRLKRLEFAQPGSEPTPARRPTITGPDGRPRTATFDATITLTDGTKVAASLLRRSQVLAEDTTDPMILDATPTYTVTIVTFTDLRLDLGETLHIVPFENIKNAEFLPGDAVLVKTKSGKEAEMNLPRRDERTLEGFTGFSAKGDFYVPLSAVKSITFPDGDTR